MTIILIFKEINPIKGFLKRWFVEVKPNVLISSISFSQSCDIIQFIEKRNREFEYLLISSDNSSQGYKIIDRTSKQEMVNIDEGYVLRKIQYVAEQASDSNTYCGDYPT